MAHNKLKPFLIIILLLSITSCEYELKKENLTGMEPRWGKQPFLLDESSENDTIEIFNPAELSYSFSAPGFDIYKANFSYKNKVWPIESLNGVLTIMPEEYVPGFDALTLTLFARSGTGSIAERFGAEGYIIKKNWVLVTDYRPAPEVVPSKSVTKEGYFKVVWPKCEQYNFMTYELNGTVNTVSRSKTITAADSSFYVDSCYIGGSASYRVRSGVFTNYSRSIDNTLSFGDPYPTIKTFEDLSPDSIKITWNKSKYNAKYRLVVGTGTVFESTKDTTFTVANPGFGVNGLYTIYTSPNVRNTANALYTKSDIKMHIMGPHIGGGTNNYGYCSANKTVYTGSDNSIYSFDAATASLLLTRNISERISQGQFSCPTNSGKVAALSEAFIYVFDDKNLVNPVKFPFNCNLSLIDHFCLTDNDRVTVVNNNNFYVISIPEMILVSGFQIVDYPVYSKWACISTSQDGKYACVVTRNGIKIYNIENSPAILVYSDTRVYRSALFDVNNSDNLLLTFTNGNVLERRRVPDFSLISSTVLPNTGIVLRNIDPETGYLLMTDYINLYVMDLARSAIAFKMKSYDNKPKLYSNRLYSETGYTLDISKYLHK